MSRFNANSEREAIEWSAHALRQNLTDRSGHLVVAGILVGGLLASMTTPLLGGVLAFYCVVKGVQSAFAADKNKKLIRDSGCIAHVLKPSDFRAYRHQVGDAAICEELRYAEEEGMALSVAAWQFLEDYLPPQPVLAPFPAAQSGRSNSQQETKKQATTANVVPVIDYYDPMATAHLDIVGEMSDRVSNSLIIGIPGSGKGMLFANAARKAKEKHPKLKIFGIDPKNDQKETGYWEGCDVVKSYACMDAKPATVAVWAESAFDEYAVYAQQHERTLLIVDEGTMLGNKLQQAKCSLLVDKLTSYTSGGDSAGRNVWFMTQSPYVSGASLNLSTTSQMTSVVIAFKENIGALAQWKSAKIFKSLSLDEVSELIEKSATGRAVYYGKTGRWYMMPELTNYSGYNRDKREYLPGFTPQGNRLEESLSHSLQDSADSETNSGLSPNAELLLSYFDNVKQKTPKSIADLKDANKLRQLDSSELLKALRELIVVEHLIFDAEGRYLKPDWE